MTSLVEKWRLRHAYPDALGMWASATGAEAKALAFNAIAQDPRVLHRAARRQAISLAAQAEDFAQSLAESALTSNDTWQAVTQMVLRSIAAWRGSLKAYDHPADWSSSSPGPAIVHPDPSDPWEAARRNFPSVDDATGRLATRLLHEFGGTLLRRARQPWDHVIVLAVLRYAARRLRGEAAEREPGDTAAMAIADILAVQSYAEEVGLSPMLVGYSVHGRPAMQALGLMRDARTLRDALQTSASDAERWVRMWQQAIDFHAFAVVALDHRLVLDLPLNEAYELAAAAVRQAEASIHRPDSIAMPLLPADLASAPDVVRLHAMACLPPEAQARGDHAGTGARDTPRDDRIADNRVPSRSATDRASSGT